MKYVAKRHDYTKLGEVLRDARDYLHKQTGRKPSVEETAKQLSVTKGFVYQVEQGKRKPKDSAFERWASVYGVPSIALWKSINRIPLDWVAAFREEPRPTPADPFSQLTEYEKSALLSYLDYVRWKTAHPAPHPNTPEEGRPSGVL